MSSVFVVQETHRGECKIAFENARDAWTYSILKNFQDHWHNVWARFPYGWYDEERARKLYLKKDPMLRDAFLSLFLQEKRSVQDNENEDEDDDEYDDECSDKKRWEREKLELELPLNLANLSLKQLRAVNNYLCVCLQIRENAKEHDGCTYIWWDHDIAYYEVVTVSLTPAST